MKDHTHYVGCSATKQARDYITVTSFLQNHVRRTFKKGQDIADAIEDKKEKDFDKEAPILKVSTSTDVNIEKRENMQFGKQFEVDYALHCERVQQHRDNKGAEAAATLWNQCSNVMKSKVQSRKDCDSNVKGDPIIKLLQAIKQHAMSHESTQCRMKTICDSMKASNGQSENERTTKSPLITTTSQTF